MAKKKHIPSCHFVNLRVPHIPNGLHKTPMHGGLGNMWPFIYCTLFKHFVLYTNNRRHPGQQKKLCWYCYVTCAIQSRCTHPIHIGCFQLSTPWAWTRMINKALFCCFTSQMSLLQLWNSLTSIDVEVNKLRMGEVGLRRLTRDLKNIYL